MDPIQFQGQTISVSTDPILAQKTVADAPVVVVDVETTEITHYKASLVGVSLYVPGSGVAFYLPTFHTTVPVASLVPLPVVSAILTPIFSDPGRLVVFHNATFDLLILRWAGIVCSARVYDTLYAEHRLDNTYRDGFYWKNSKFNYRLKSLTHRFFGIAQTTFEEVTGGGSILTTMVEDAASYAAGDVVYTAAHRQRQLSRLKRPNNAGIRRVLDCYDFPLISIIVEMLHDGIDIDVALAMSKAALFRKNFSKWDAIACHIFGSNVNISKKGVLPYCLRRLGVSIAPHQSLNAKFLRDTAVDAEQARNIEASKFIRAVLSRRNFADAISKFFVPLANRTDKSGKLYVGGFHSLNETGRFAADNPNIQALPSAKKSRVRRIILPGPGRVVVAADFKNIEPRCLAQALLMFIAEQGSKLRAIKSDARTRARSLFGHLLPFRKFTRPYQPKPPLPHPTQSLLADFFLQGAANPDPYVFIAQQAFGIANPTKAERDRMKTVVLGVIYGKGITSLSRDMKDKNLDQTYDTLNKFAAVMPELGVPTFIKSKGQWVKAKPQIRTYKDETWDMLRHSGEVTSLFGRKRRFSGLYHLRKCERCRLIVAVKDPISGRYRQFEWTVAPVQLWDYTLHSYVYSVRSLPKRTAIATRKYRKPLSILHRPSLTKWPFHQISYRSIRRVEIGDDLVHFTPIEDCQRRGFNAVIQMTAGDVFKQAILNVYPVMKQFDVRMVTNVHDEIVFSVPKSVLHQFVPLMVAAMTQPPTPWWTIPIEVDVEVGLNYGQLVDYTPSYTP